MKYYLSLDSGGTKVAAVLYGEDLSRRSAAVCGSLRRNTTPAGLVKAHAMELVDKLGVRGMRIEALYGTFEPYAAEELSKVCEIGEIKVTGELDMGLSAAGIFGDGILALCGTGSTVFARLKGNAYATGGYGAAVSDEGSGYWIGRQAFIAAIRDSEGRGPRTSLTDAIPEKLGFGGRDRLREAVFSIYRDDKRSPTASVASFTPTVADEAERGDAVARGIMEESASLISAQLSYLCKRYEIPDDIPLTLSGSVWRGNPVFTRTFLDQIGNRPVIIPKLEPVLGAPAKHRYIKTGSFSDEDAVKLAADYPEFAYDVNRKK